LEKIILKANKLINYFHNAAEVLGKQMSQILHHLLMQIEYDMKNITAKIVTSDVNTLYDWIRSFDNNEYLKKRKIFQNMGPKINFYKKLEIPTLQKAYNRLFSFLKENDRLGERGEFSILNTTGANFLGKSHSKLLLNRSIMSNSKLGLESMNEGNNILDELDEEKKKLDPR